MLVTCKLCKKKIDKNSAFKIKNTSEKTGKVTNSYYCSEAEYKSSVLLATLKSEINDLCYEILGYKVVNTAFFREIGTLFKNFKLDDIKNYLYSNKESLMTVMSKNFSSEYGKIRYFFTIVSNNIKDFSDNYRQQFNEKNKEVDVEIYKSKYKRKNKRVPLSFYEEDY